MKIADKTKKLVPFPVNDYIYLVGLITIYILYFLARILGFKGPINEAGFIIVVCVIMVIFGFWGLILFAAISTKINKQAYEKKVNEFNKSKTNSVIKKVIKSIMVEAIFVSFLIFLAVGVSLLFKTEWEIFYNNVPYLFPMLYTGLSVWTRLINRTGLSVILGVIGFFFSWLIAIIFVPILKLLINIELDFGAVVLILVAILGSPLWVLIFQSFFQEEENKN